MFPWAAGRSLWRMTEFVKQLHRSLAVAILVRFQHKTQSEGIRVGEAWALMKIKSLMRSPFPFVCFLLNPTNRHAILWKFYSRIYPAVGAKQSLRDPPEITSQVSGTVCSLWITWRSNARGCSAMQYSWPQEAGQQLTVCFAEVHTEERP